MRLIPSDPDIETILRRIEADELDLQPGFQRGEVWSRVRQQRLIDSILRDWHVPPIHVVETAEGLEVLDGQQRLVAIREFARGHLKIDGKTEPRAPFIEAVHGKTFHQLPPDLTKRFQGFPIRLFTIVDYKVGEPAELFYRLNQPVTLTGPEQRNAFYGPVRDQIREIVERYEKTVLTKDFLGFTNSRMSYDDVVSRVCFALETGTIRTKITTTVLANRYRMGTPFEKGVVEPLEAALSSLVGSRAEITPFVRFNKATLFSWIWLVASRGAPTAFKGKGLGRFVSSFESARQLSGGLPSAPEIGGRLPNPVMSLLLRLFHDRASSRVSDIFSVVARDFALSAALYSYGRELGLSAGATDRGRKEVLHVVDALNDWITLAESDRDPEEAELPSLEVVLERELESVEWGRVW